MRPGHTKERQDTEVGIRDHVLMESWIGSSKIRIWSAKNRQREGYKPYACSSYEPSKNGRNAARRTVPAEINSLNDYCRVHPTCLGFRTCESDNQDSCWPRRLNAPRLRFDTSTYRSILRTRRRNLGLFPLHSTPAFVFMPRCTIRRVRIVRTSRLTRVLLSHTWEVLCGLSSKFWGSIIEYENRYILHKGSPEINDNTADAPST